MKPSVRILGSGVLGSTIEYCLIVEGFRVTRDVGMGDILWVAIDTPIGTDNRGHPEQIAVQLAEVQPRVGPGTLVLISSQVPVGFTARIEQAWRAVDPTLRFAYAAENVRTAHAVEDFQRQDRILVGLGYGTPKGTLAALLQPFTKHIEWMSLESAEFSKHALNGYLALSAAYANELHRLGEHLGVDPHAVEYALRSDPRVGDRAYVAASGPIGGGHLLRDVNVLLDLAERQGIAAPLAEAIIESDRLHAAR